MLSVFEWFLFCSVILSLLLFCMMNQGRNKGRGLVDRKLGKPPPPQSFHCWPSQCGFSVSGSLVILDVARCYLWLFS